MSALDPAGPGAGSIAELFTIYLAVAAIVWLLVILGLALALGHRRAAAAPATLEEAEAAEPPARRIVVSLLVLTAIILAVLTSLSFFTGRSLASLGGDQPLLIEVTGQQFWWKVQYPAEPRSDTVTTANEIHVPAGKPVRLVLTSPDVIHSFWVPQITGKRDLIPGQVNRLDFIVSNPGIFEGQCAEFCGFQHAHMRIVVIAEPEQAFEDWRKRQLAEAAQPKGDEAAKGRDTFLGKGCVMCHQIRGTLAGGRSGPELTHVASRRGIAANTMPFTRGALAAWIADPQAVKPGAHMPKVDLSADELNQVVAYLEQLK